MNAAGLRERSLRSVLWVALLQLLVGGLYFAVPLTLSRLVTPADLGLLELLVSVVALGVVVVDLGTGPAVVQRPQLEPVFCSTVFWVNVSNGGLVALAVALGAGPLAPILGGDARLAPMLRGAALGFVLSAAAVVPEALLVRRMEFRALTKASVLAVSAAAGAGALAFSRQGVSGAVWGFVAFALVKSAAVWFASGFRPLFTLQAREVWPLLRFGGSAFGATAGERVAQQTERSLIAVFLGADSLGLFVLARSLIRDPLRRLMSVSDDILFPGLASLQGDRPRAQRYYLAALRCELGLFGPAIAFVGVFAAELARLFYGPAWQHAALIAQLLALHTWRSISSHSIGAIFLSHGRPEVRLRWVLISIALVPLYFFAGRPWGLPGYAASCSLVGILGWAISHTLANRVIGLEWARLWGAMRRPLLAHLVFALVLLAVRGAVASSLQAEPRLVLLFAAAALPLYAGVLAAVDRGLLVSLRQTALDVLHAGRTTPRAA